MRSNDIISKKNINEKVYFCYAAASYICERVVASCIKMIGYLFVRKWSEEMYTHIDVTQEK